MTPKQVSTKVEEKVSQVEEKVTEEKEVKKPKFDKEELLTIFDEIMFSGEYREDITIKNRLKITFKTRTAAEVSAMSKEVDGLSFNMIATLHEKRAFLQVVYSLVNYAGKDISALDIEKKKDFVGKLPAVVVAALSDALIKFDEKTAAAYLEGEENF